jgi:poly-gamma-glutamate capsule biosynthesis protein CapA/YwtB (metallophosphatase superfamily)
VTDPVRAARRQQARRRRDVRRRRAIGLGAITAIAVGIGVAIASAGGGDGPAGETLPLETGSTGSATTSAASGGTTTAAAPLRNVTIGWAGDMVPASSTIALPSDPASLLAGVKDSLSAPDITMVNLEGTLTEGGTSKCGAGSSNCFAFRAPPSYAATFRRAGIDVVNQANNHAYDYGSSGYADTRRAVRRAGLKSTGGPEDVTVVTHDGVRVAFVGFASYSWSGPLNDAGGVRALVGRAKDRADLVVVAFHGGAEGSSAQHVPRGDETYLGEDRGDLRRFARTAIDAGADLVVGSGPHVIRGMEFYKGHLVAYSAGNFVGYGGVFGLAGPTAVSYILEVTLRSDGRFRSGRIIPTLLDGSGIAAHDSSGQAIALVRSLTADDFPSTGARIGESGAIRLPT